MGGESSRLGGGQEGREWEEGCDVREGDRKTHPAFWRSSVRAIVLAMFY